MPEPPDESSADFWRAKYEALKANLRDPVAVENAIELANASLKMSVEFNRPLREIHTLLLQTLRPNHPVHHKSTRRQR